jgi:hypothetical protein
LLGAIAAHRNAKLRAQRRLLNPLMQNQHLKVLRLQVPRHHSAIIVLERGKVSSADLCTHHSLYKNAKYIV